MTPLMWAAWQGKAAVVELFISSSAKLDRQEKWGRTALFLAADEGHSEVVGDIVGRYATFFNHLRVTLLFAIRSVCSCVQAPKLTFLLREQLFCSCFIMLICVLQSAGR